MTTAAAEPPLSPQVAAEMLGVSRRTIYRWAEEGRIPEIGSLRRSNVEPLIGVVRPMKMQPNPRSARYAQWKHRFPAERARVRERPFLDYGERD